MTRIFLVLVCYIVIISVVQHFARGAGMIEVFRWKQIDYYNRGDNANTGPIRNKDTIVFPDQPRPHRRHHRETVRTTSRDDPVSTDTRFSTLSSSPRSTNSSFYIPSNNLPMGATHHNGRLFITVPRRRTGIPSTLNYIDLRRDGNDPSPKLHAYPNYETNFIDSNNLVANTNRLISVYRTTVDACQRLWFVDTGMLEYPNNRIQVQRPTIWVIDLKTDRVLTRFPIPESIVNTGRGLASIAVDVTLRHCDSAYAYIPDLLENRLYVFNLANRRIWSFSHNYFNFDPIAGDLNVGGQSFRWDDGIFSITMSPIQTNGYRQVYFHAMASNNEFVVSSAVLQNEANAARDDHGQDFRLLGKRGDNRQSTMHSFDPLTGIIFYDEIQQNGIGCWNTGKPFSESNHGTVVQDAQNIIYPSDLTIDDQGTMWVMANSLPIFIYSNLDPNVYNFHVWKQNVREAVRGTICA